MAENIACKDHVVVTSGKDGKSVLAEPSTRNADDGVSDHAIRPHS